MTVYKFGGTSLADAQRYRHAASLVRKCAHDPVVVVSAPAGITDELISLAAETTAGAREGAKERAAALGQRLTIIGRELASSNGGLLSRIESLISGLERTVSEAGAGDGGRLCDAVCGYGEDVSAELMAAALQAEGLDSLFVDARRMVRTDDRFGCAVPRADETARLVRDVLGPLLKRGCVPVLQGFVGATPAGVTTTLGRGGSDFTAAIVGAALGADEVSIWTDVDGVMSADPAYVEAARTIHELGYEEAVELAYFGARAIHPAAAKHAAAGDVILRIRNSFRPDAPGTIIRPDKRRAAAVAAIAHKPAVTLLKVRSRPMFMAYGFLARVFEALTAHRTPVDLVATSHISTAFTIDDDEGLDAICSQLEDFAEVEVLPGLATVSIIGHGLLRQPGIAARVFAALGTTRVELISQASGVSLSLLVAAEDAASVVRRLHHELIENGGETA